MAALPDKIKVQITSVTTATRNFYSANRMIILGAATIFSILLIAWARIGFSLQFSQFFAANPTPATLGVTCSTTTATLTWNIPTGATANSIQKNINGQGWTFILEDAGPPFTKTTTTDTFTPTTQYRHKSDPGVASNIVQCPAVVATATATATTAATLPPTATDRAPIGNNDGPNYVATTDASRGNVPANVIVGWAFDPDDATKPLEIHLYFDGTPDCTSASGCLGVTGVIANGQSTDVLNAYKTLNPTITNNHGFFYDITQLPAKFLDGAEHSVRAYAININAAGVQVPALNAYLGEKTFHYAAVATTAPPPAAVPVVCSPKTQQIVVSGTPSGAITATGGNCPGSGNSVSNVSCTYAWTADAGVTLSSTTGSSVTATYTNTTNTSVTKNVTVHFGPDQSDTCSIVVPPGPTATATATVTAQPSATLSMATSGANASTGGTLASTVTLAGGQQVLVQMVVGNESSATIIPSVVVSAILPAGLVYVPGSTTSNGAAVASDAITSGGIALGGLGAPEHRTITFRARVNTASFPTGQSQRIISTRAHADGLADSTGQITAIINRSSGQVGGVQTGPGDAVVVAMVISAIMTLLYVSYTHTSVFRRHEIDSLTSERDPMDFRS